MTESFSFVFVFADEIIRGTVINIRNRDMNKFMGEKLLIIVFPPGCNNILIFTQTILVEYTLKREYNSHSRMQLTTEL